MKDHYSLLAPIYNRLTKLVFGDQLMLAKSHFAENLSNKKVLIIGGGDGLDYQDFQRELFGVYLEISQSMLNKAKVNLGESNLIFHLGFFQAKEGESYDEIWLHFVLDTMLDEEIALLLQEIKNSLNPGGKIYLADFFASQNLYQRFLNRSMITLFRIVADHKRGSIPDYEGILLGDNWEKNSEQEFLQGWVKAQIWRLG